MGILLAHRVRLGPEHHRRHLRPQPAGGPGHRDGRVDRYRRPLVRRRAVVPALEAADAAAREDPDRVVHELGGSVSKRWGEPDLTKAIPFDLAAD